MFFTKYKFFSRAQESGEAIDQYVTVSRKMSETCMWIQHFEKLPYQR